MEDDKLVISDGGAVLGPKEVFRRLITKAEEKIASIPGSLIGDSEDYLKVCPMKHTFVDSGYVREVFLPKGMFFITKIHKKTHPYFVMVGDVSVITETGIVRLVGPFNGITIAGTKRFIYTHEDTVWITVHSTKETELEKIEEELIARTFYEVGNTEEVTI